MADSRPPARYSQPSQRRIGGEPFNLPLPLPHPNRPNPPEDQATRPVIHRPFALLMEIWTGLAAGRGLQGGRAAQAFSRRWIPCASPHRGGESIGVIWVVRFNRQRVVDIAQLRVVGPSTRQSAPPGSGKRRLSTNESKTSRVQLPFSPTLQAGRSVPSWRSAGRRGAGQAWALPLVQQLPGWPKQGRARPFPSPCPFAQVPALCVTGARGDGRYQIHLCVADPCSPSGIDADAAAPHSPQCLIRSAIATRQPREGVARAPRPS